MKNISNYGDLGREISELMGAEATILDAKRVQDCVARMYTRPLYGSDWTAFLDELDLWKIAETIESIRSRERSLTMTEETKRLLKLQHPKMKWKSPQ